jgi:hypothetical protein
VTKPKKFAAVWETAHVLASDIFRQQQTVKKPIGMRHALNEVAVDARRKLGLLSTVIEIGSEGV